MKKKYDPVEFRKMLGQKVVKRSNKPFKSGDKINTATGIAINEEDPKKREGFTFEEDDSIVNCELCKPSPED